jgi:hypothetical protein
LTRDEWDLIKTSKVVAFSSQGNVNNIYLHFKTCIKHDRLLRRVKAKLPDIEPWKRASRFFDVRPSKGALEEKRVMGLVKKYEPELSEDDKRFASETIRRAFQSKSMLDPSDKAGLMAEANCPSDVEYIRLDDSDSDQDEEEDEEQMEDDISADENFIEDSDASSDNTEDEEDAEEDIPDDPNSKYVQMVEKANKKGDRAYKPPPTQHEEDEDEELVYDPTVDLGEEKEDEKAEKEEEEEFERQAKRKWFCEQCQGFSV